MWTLKFNNFSEFQNFISDIPPRPSVIMAHCVRKSICDSPLSNCHAWLVWAPFGLKKLHLKNRWNLHVLLFIYCWKVIKRVDFIDFLSAIFEPEMCLCPHFLYYWSALTIIYRVLPPCIISYQRLYYFYHFLPLFITFCKFLWPTALPTFILLLFNWNWQQMISYNFSHFHYNILH